MNISVQGASQASAQINSMGNTVNHASDAMKHQLVEGAKQAGETIIELGVKSAEMAGDFEASMIKIKTSAGETGTMTSGNLKTVADGILNLATQTGTSTEDLANAMYYIESSGARGADGLNMLKAAAEGAKLENVDTMQVTRALLAVMQGYHMPASQAADAMNSLVVATSHGGASLNELTGAMAAVLPTASSLHIPFEQVASAIGVMTNKQTTARQASQNLAHVLLALEAPNSKAADSMKLVGTSAQEVRDALVNKGLPEALQLIEDHVGKKFPKDSVEYTTTLEQIMGGIVGFKVAAQLTGPSLKDMKSSIDAVKDAARDGKGEIIGWTETQDTFNVKIAKAKEVVETLGIKVGQALLPVVGHLVDIFADNLLPAFDWLTAHSDVLIPVLVGLGVTIASILVPATWAWASATIAATWPFLAIGAAVAGLVAIFMHFYQTNAGFRDFIDGLVKSLKQIATTIWGDVQAAIKFLTPYFNQAKQAVGDFAKEVIDRLIPFLRQVGDGLNILLVIWKAAWPQIADILKGTWDQIVGIVKIAWALLTGIIKIGLDILSGNWGQAWEDFKTMLVGVWDGIKTYLKGAIESLVGLFRPLLVAMAQIPGPAGDMARSVLKAFDSMNQGAQQSTDQMRAVVYANQAKMHTAAVVELEQMRQQIIAKIKNCSDETQKHTLEMKLKSVDQMEQMHKAAADKAASMSKQVVGHMTSMKDQVVGHSIIPDMVNAVIAWFAQLPTRAVRAIATLPALIGGIFLNMATQATSWGSHIGENVATGLRNAIGSVTNAATNVASTISSILHHSKPEIGPLANDDEWMPDFMTQLAEGMNKNIGKIQRASLNVAATIGAPMPSSRSGFSVMPAMQQAATPIQIIVQPAPVTLDGRVLTSGLLPHIADQIRTNTGIRTY